MKRIKIIFCILSLSASAFCQVKLPKLISDGMVLQRDARVNIWGWAREGEKVSVEFIGSTYRTVADTSGKWNIVLPKIKAGGPYEMRFSASNSVTVHDIMIGDVWVCAGQSNMGLPMIAVRSNYEAEIANSSNKHIRQFSVPVKTEFHFPQQDMQMSSWKSADPKNVLFFSAVAYFFARNLYDKYKIPIGLINASLGGSSAEAWISEESITSFPKYWEDAQRFKDPDLMGKINKQDNERVKNWNALLRQDDEGYKNPQEPWFDPKLNTSQWDTMHVPGYWTDIKPGLMNGVVWLRKGFTIPSTLFGKPALLRLGRIFDADSVYVNGRFAGTSGSQYAPRAYKIADGLLREGENIIVVRDISYIRHGGFVPGKQYEIVIGDSVIHLEGEWKYKRGASAEPLEDRLFTGKIPTGLFNGMIAPLVKYTMKGVVWYQGESNTSRAFEHYELFKLLMKDWRDHWQQGNFPFLYVQLPNFVEVNTETTKYDWAYFRESQLKALSIPNTGMAVSIDVGEGNDIHPLKKREVGYRLALAAQKVAYGEKHMTYSGPMYQSMKIEGKKIILSFTNVGSGLTAKKGAELNCFEICGIDHEYIPAEAKIEHNRIIVWSKKVTSPVAVRYAWANNPEGANLYNKEGLPASPFRTDDY